jgi:hypothetical protein
MLHLFNLLAFLNVAIRVVFIFFFNYAYLPLNLISCMCLFMMKFFILILLIRNILIFMNIFSHNLYSKFIIIRAVNFTKNVLEVVFLNANFDLSLSNLEILKGLIFNWRTVTSDCRLSSLHFISSYLRACYSFEFISASPLKWLTAIRDDP